MMEEQWVDLEGLGGSAKVFAINLTERLMTISKSFELSSAPTCQNLDKSPRIHFFIFLYFVVLVLH